MTPTIKIIGRGGSTCCRRVMAVCNEIGIKYEIVEVDFAKIKQPEHLAIHPFGQVPVMDDNGFQLYESRAIARYLVRKYGKHTTLLPSETDIEASAKFDVAANIEQTNFDPFVSVIVFEKVIKPFHGGPTNEALVNDLTQKLEAKLEGYERILSKQKYLAGDTYTLADLFHLPYGHKFTQTGSDLLIGTKYPHVARWWKDISERPAWQPVKDST